MFFSRVLVLQTVKNHRLEEERKKVDPLITSGTSLIQHAMVVAVLVKYTNDSSIDIQQVPCGVFLLHFRDGAKHAGRCRSIFEEPQALRTCSETLPF
jgi:hypothetical protein